MVAVQWCGVGVLDWCWWWYWWWCGGDTWTGMQAGSSVWVQVPSAWQILVALPGGRGVKTKFKIFILVDLTHIDMDMDINMDMWKYSQVHL